MRTSDVSPGSAGTAKLGTDPEIGTTVALGDVGEVVEKRAGKRRLPCLGVDLENLSPGDFVWEREEEFPVEAARPAKGRVDGVRPVGRADNDDLATAVHAVHKCEQGRDDARMDLILLAAADRRET